MMSDITEGIIDDADSSMFAFTAFAQAAWFRELLGLEHALAKEDAARVVHHYRKLTAALLRGGHANLAAAFADTLLFGPSAFALAAQALANSKAQGAQEGGAGLPAGMVAAAQQDLTRLQKMLGRDYYAEAAVEVQAAWLDAPLVRLEALAPAASGSAAEVAALLSTQADALLGYLVAHYAAHGVGKLARYPAFRWVQGGLEGIAEPAWADASRLVGVEKLLRRLEANTEAFLAGQRAQHVLLYGPRGSGKSTALRSLGAAYAARGLRFVEVAPEALRDLPHILAMLRQSPHRYVLYADDLAFAAGSSSYAPLKSLLEGSLSGDADNVRVYATSNRRHLVKESMSDRPDPLNDDVRAWDSEHERLALADRFGLVLTFPDMTQRRYLEVTASLLEREGFGALATHQDAALRFADWGNGYSGRTAQQFIEALKSGLVP